MTRVPVEILIEDGPLAKASEIDIFLDRQLVIETKSVEAIHIRHVTQTKTYLRAAPCRLGYVFNFGTPRLGIRRVVP